MYRQWYGWPSFIEYISRRSLGSVTDDMNYSDASQNKAKPKWVTQTVADLRRMEGFREYAYPDPLSVLGKRYASPKYGWGFSPGDALLAKYGENARDGIPWTIGYGRTKNVTPATRTTQSYEDKDLENDLITVRVPILNKLTPSWDTMPLFAQTVLLNLAYNLGGERLAKFTGTLAEFNANRWISAGQHLKDSLWFKQVGNRAVELVARMTNQKIDPRYQVV